MSVPTRSDLLFERLCVDRGLVPRRIPVGNGKTADYKLDLGSVTLIVEVKEKEADGDSDLGASESENEDGVVAPSRWVKKQIGDSYKQLKNSANEVHPTLLVLYNNAGLLHFIDDFSVSKGMFGTMGIKLALSQGEVAAVGQGFYGGRKLTKDSSRSLSAVGVIKEAADDRVELVAYHNPYACIPIQPAVLAKIASEQYVHPAPHEGEVVGWSLLRVET